MVDSPAEGKKKGISKLLPWGSSKVSPGSASTAGLRQRHKGKEENAPKEAKDDKDAEKEGMVGGRTHSIAVSRLLSLNPSQNQRSQNLAVLNALPPPVPVPPPMVVTTELARADTLRSRDRVPSAPDSPASPDALLSGQGNSSLRSSQGTSSSSARGSSSTGWRPRSPADVAMADAAAEAVDAEAELAAESSLPNMPLAPAQSS